MRTARKVSYLLWRARVFVMWQGIWAVAGWRHYRLARAAGCHFLEAVKMGLVFSYGAKWRLDKMRRETRRATP